MCEDIYIPKKEILEKYADVLINFALNKGEGIKEGEVVELVVPEIAKPILKPLYKAALKAKAQPIIKFLPDDMEDTIYKYGSDKQLKFFPEKLLKGKIDTVNHMVAIIANKNPTALKDVDPKKLMMAQEVMKPYKEWRDEKENKGDFSWTLCLYGTPANAKEANLTQEEYWDEIIKACYLNEENPSQKWKEINTEIQRVCKELTNMQIDKVHLEAEGTDLWVKIGDKRKWLGGRGNNIPSFEVFTSPDWRGTNGTVQFTEPLYRYGNLITDVKLELKDGIVTNYQASSNQELLDEIFKVENANKIGEFSLTDGRLSKITKFMAETLFDENVGGPQGNTHLAIGSSFDDTYDGDASTLNDEIRDELGFNKSIIHIDIVATSKRKVTAYQKNGEEKVIYQDGKFLI